LSTIVAAVPAAAAPSAQVWVTTPTGGERLADRGTVEFQRGGSDELTISIDPSRSYQRMDVAFRTRDGSTVLVVHNENDDPRTFAVAQGGRSFEYTLPGGALATFTWEARLEDGLELLDAERMTASAQHPGQRRERRRRRRHDALDYGRGPGTGPVAAGRPRRRPAHPPRGARHGRRPRRLPARLRALYEPRRRHLDAVGFGAGSGQLTTIDFPPTTARYVRVTTTASAPQWWSVADLRVYR
jgi:glucosylceramidase